MKRTLLAFSVCMLLAPLAHAGPDAKRFSLGIGVGLRPDMAGLGSTITQDGSVDTADTTMASMVYSTGQALMSDRNNLAIWHNSSHTDSAFNLLGSEPDIGGAMFGMEFGGRLRYELDDVVNFPLFVQTGFHYTQRTGGGQQTRTLGDAITQSASLSALLEANGLNPEDYVGGTMATNYDASWFEIPITVGIKVPVKRDYTFAYGALGISLFQGGFSVEMDVDEQYANVLATHIDEDALTVTNYSPGAVNDTISFRLGGMGLNYMVGAQVGVAGNLALYMEMNSSGTSKVVYSSALKPETRQLLTAMSSSSLADADPEWFKRLSFPVLTTGASFRAGLRYYFF